MKIKLSWIFFVPALVAVVGLKVVQSLYTSQGTSFFDFNNITDAYFALIISAVLLILCGFISLFDKKTSGLYINGKNIPSALLSFMLAIVIGSEATSLILNIVNTNNYQVLDFIDIPLSIVATIAFIVIGLGHLTEKSYSNGMSVLILMPAIWCCLRIILIFMGYRSFSVNSTDMTDLVGYVFITLYLYANATVLAKMPGTNPVKACFIYGLPAMTVAFGFSAKVIADIATGAAQFDYFENIRAIEFLIIALYILSNLIELTAKAKTKEKVNAYIVEEFEDKNMADEFEETKSDSQGIVRESIIIDDEDNTITEKSNVIKNRNNEFNENNKSVAEYEDIPDDYVAISQNDSSKSRSPYSDRLDEIDQLIFEIQSGTSNNSQK